MSETSQGSPFYLSIDVPVGSAVGSWGKLSGVRTAAARRRSAKDAGFREQDDRVAVRCAGERLPFLVGPRSVLQCRASAMKQGRPRSQRWCSRIYRWEVVRFSRYAAPQRADALAARRGGHAQRRGCEQQHGRSAAHCPSRLGCPHFPRSIVVDAQRWSGSWTSTALAAACQSPPSPIGRLSSVVHDALRVAPSPSGSSPPRYRRKSSTPPTQHPSSTGLTRARPSSCMIRGCEQMTSDPAGSGHLRCPRCGLTITPRALWLRVEHCPRRLAKQRVTVALLATTLPSGEEGGGR